MRSPAGRRGAVSRGSVRNAVVSGMDQFLSSRDRESAQVARINLQEFRRHLRPIFEHPPAAWTAGGGGMLFNERAHGLFIFAERHEIDRGQIAALLGKIAGLIEYVGEASAHAGGE